MPVDWSKIGPRKRVETTYADLRPNDLVIDKAGHAWPIDPKDIAGDAERVGFWLCDSVTKVRMHYLTKPKGDPVTVSRVETAADEAAKLEADFPTVPIEAFQSQAEAAEAEFIEGVRQGVNQRLAAIEAPAVVDVAAVAQQVVEEQLGGVVEADVTSEEIDAAQAATDDEPVQLPAFEDMTILEMRSHLYLLHGVYAADLKSRDETIRMHTQAHADHESGKLKSKHVPHIHAEVK